MARHGLRAADIRAVPAAAGGPKGLILNPLDRFLFGHWLTGPGPSVHLAGASIGAWRLACACLPDADAALARLAEDYIAESYAPPTGERQSARNISARFAALLEAQLDGRQAELLAHPRLRLHVLTSRGRHLLRRERPGITHAGYLAAFGCNLLSRRALGLWLERVVFSDPREALPLTLSDLPTRRVALTPANLQPSIIGSGSIPFWLEAVHDIEGGPRGAYWDGGITDYHMHLPYRPDAGLVLYPHFQKAVVPGWLDKSLKWRHRSTAALHRMVVLAPNPDWVRTLPNAKLPDRTDFTHYGQNLAARMQAWNTAVAESQRLADEFARWLERPDMAQVQPL